MLARDIMSSPVVTVGPSSSVAEVVATIHERGIGGVPVLDDEGNLVGMVTEADLIHRYEIGTDRVADLRAWWRRFATNDSVAQVRQVARTHGAAHHVFARSPVRHVGVDATLGDVASVLGGYRIGRVPVLSGDHVAGIITRADLVRAIAGQPQPDMSRQVDDETIRRKLLEDLSAQPWWNGTWQNVHVRDGVVIFKGVVESDVYRLASRIAAETAGARGVQDDRVLGIDATGMV